MLHTFVRDLQGQAVAFASFATQQTVLKLAPAEAQAVTYTWVSRVLLQGQAELLLESHLIYSYGESLKRK